MKEASYTVEAVFVTSICVWVLLALIYGSLYIHDRTILGSVTNELTKRHFQAAEATVSEKWKKDVKEDLSKRLFLMQINKVEAKKELTCVKVKVSYRLPISVTNIKTLFTGKATEEYYETAKERVQPVEYKWDYGVLKENETKQKEKRG